VYEGDIASVLITEEQIKDKVAELAEKVAADYPADKTASDLVLVGVLKGAVMFMTDFARALPIPAQLEFMAVSWLLKNLASRNPASLAVCSLLRKREAVKVDVPVRYIGFDIPNEFVVGYGLDYAERYRDLPFIGTLHPRVYSS
jgi:hypoxanthine phosphoribosyltransferase